MSLILDALNRSRQDESPVPGLATQHPVEHLDSERRNYLPWVALSLALALIAWLLIERYSTPPVPAEDIGAPVAELSRNIGSAVSSVTGELKARAARAEQERQTAAVAAEPAPAIATLPAPPVTAPATPEVVAPTPSPAAIVTESVDVTVQTLPAAQSAAVAELYAHPAVEEEPARKAPVPGLDKPGAARAEHPVDLDQILRVAREEAKKVGMVEHPAPFLADLSQQTKDSIPTLYYQHHDYSSDASRSEVILNGAPVRVGGSPLPGMKVEEILPDSVILNYQGTQFRLRALNSWVNL